MQLSIGGAGKPDRQQKIYPQTTQITPMRNWRGEPGCLELCDKSVLVFLFTPGFPSLEKCFLCGSNSQ